MKIKTTRFGELNVEKNDILIFPEGILGFEHLRKMFIVDPGDKTLILWLQSLEEGHIAFPIIEPHIFRPDLSIKLLPSEIALLEIAPSESPKIYTILTVPQDVTKMSANLKAPLMINTNKKIGRQIVLQDNKLLVKFDMYRELKKYIVEYASDDSKRTNVKPNLDSKTTPEILTFEQNQVGNNTDNSDADNSVTNKTSYSRPLAD